jgi:non-ribosomal peptide synthetase component F
MSRSPLFQVTFTWQNAPGEALQLEGLSLSTVGSADETTNFELMLILGERGDAIVGGLNYNRDLYEAATIGRMMESYERVLQAVVADAEQRVLQIELLSAAERRQIVAGWNETRREYSGAVAIHQLFSDRQRGAGKQWQWSLVVSN